MGVVARWGVCVAICAALIFSLLTMQSPAAAQSALLDTLSSRVTLTRESLVAEVTDERIIRSGDTVATDPTGHAIVTYPDGSTALLEESSELTIEFVRTTAGDYVVRMQQTLGRVWYAVAKTVASGGRYEVRSAAMASVIRAGSGSLVAVAPGGDTTVVATTGSVETSAGGTSVTVPAGAATIVTPAGTPSPPGPAAALTSPMRPAPKPIGTLAAPRPQIQPPETTHIATQTRTAPTMRTPAPSATPTSAFEPPVSTLPPLPPVIASAKPIRTSVPTAAPTSSTTRAPSAEPSHNTGATPSASAKIASTLPTVLPTPTAKPTAAPAPVPVPTTPPTTAAKDQYGPRKDKPGQPALPPQGTTKRD